MKSLRMSNLSLEEISQCLCSLISVKSQGLMSAPLQPKEKFKKIVIPITDAPEDLRHFPELISALNLLFHSNKKLQLIQTNFTNFQSGFTERKFHALGLFRDFLILFFIFSPLEPPELRSEGKHRHLPCNHDSRNSHLHGSICIFIGQNIPISCPERREKPEVKEIREDKSK